MYAPRGGLWADRVHQLGPIATGPRRDRHDGRHPALKERTGQSPATDANRFPVHIFSSRVTRRTSLELTDERERRLERARELVAADEYDEPPMSVVIAAALQHLLESEQNIQNARGEVDPETIQRVANTSVLGLRYRTSVESKWR